MKSLSDVVGAAGLHTYAEIALIIFFVVFVLVVVRALMTRSRDLEHVARLPLDDDGTTSARDAQRRRTP